MGGGRSVSDQVNTTTNTNTVADNGAVSIGQDAAYNTEETSMNVGLNSGILLGAGASYTDSGLDGNSYNLLDQAQTLQFRTTENILKLKAAEASAEPADIQYAEPGSMDYSSNGIEGWKLLLVVAVIAVAAFLFARRRKKK